MIVAGLLGGLGLLLGAGIVAAHLARRRAKRAVVGSLRLLRAAAGTASTRRLIPRLKHRISMVLVLLALAVAVVGLAADGCVSASDGRVILVVDGGAGMARETPGGESLIGAARTELAAWLPSLGARELAVVVAGESPTVPVGLSPDPGLVLAAVDAIVPSGRADVAEAIELADVLCKDPEHDLILVVTDNLRALPEAGCPLRRVSLPAAEPNAGIATLVARPTDGLGLVEVVVSVAADGPEPSEVQVELLLDDQLVDAFTLVVPAGAQATSVRRVTGPGELLVARLVDGGGATGSDDRAELRIGQVPAVRVGLVTDRPEGLLATALKLHPGAEVKVVAPEDSQSLDALDLAVLEVNARPPPTGRLVLVGDAVRLAELQQDAPLNDPKVTRWAFDDPVLRFVELDALVLRRAHPLELAEGATALIEAEGRPVAIRGELAERPMVALGFAISDSDLALRVDFLHLVANLVDWAAPAPGSSAEGRAHDPGRGEIAAGPGVLGEIPVISGAGARGLPWWMWAVGAAMGLLVIELVVAALRPWRRTSTLRKVGAWAIRGAVLGVLALSLAGLRWVLPGGSPTVVFVVDRSASVGDQGLEAAQARVELLAAGGSAGTRTALVFVDGTPAVSEDWPEVVRTEAVAASDLGAGVQAALGLIDPAGGGRIVVLTDGGDTRGALPAAVESARHRGVPVDFVGLPEATGDPALMALELAEDVVRPGETVQGVVTLRGPAGGASGRLVVDIGGDAVYDELVELPEGRSRARFEVDLPDAERPGPRRLDVRLVPQGPDQELANNLRSTSITVSEPPRLLMVVSDPREVEGLRRVVEAEGMKVRVRPPSKVGPEDLREADVLVLGDVPVSTEDTTEEVLDPKLLGAVRAWVSDGGGLITMGGDRNYELGGWGETSLAAVLPLELSAESEDLEPAVTLVQILDSSASMGDWSGYQTKMALANEGAVASMRLLRPRDTLAVLAVSTSVDRVVPPQSVTDPLRLSAAIRSIKPGGGGIYTYTSLVAAQGILRRSDTPLKHVVLYADAQDAEEMVRGIPFGFGPGPTAFEVAKSLRVQGATLSVIALGDPRDQHVGFLQDLARLGGGRFRITKEPSELRALFVEETRQVVRTVVHDIAFAPRLVVEHPTLQGVPIEHAPDLLGYVEVRPRDTADVVLTGPDDRPILVTWQYGLGHVAAWATDLGPRWGERWLDWEHYSRLVLQQVRWALRPPVARGANVEVVPHHDGLGLVVTRYDAEGLTLPDRGVVARLQGEDGVRPVELRLSAPGRWQGSAKVAVGSAHTLVLQDEATGETLATQELVVPEGPEREVGGRDALPELAATAGGSMDPDSLGPTSAGLGQGQALGWWLALLALLLLPLDAWIRVPVRG